MKRWLQKLTDPERDVYERRYRLLSALSIAVLFLWIVFAWIVDGYSTRILIFGAADLLFIPTMIFTLRSGKIQLGAGGSAFALVFILLPCAFFFNGGIYAGAPNWCIIAVIFIMLTVKGRLRNFLLLSDLIVTAACYFATWKVPRLVEAWTVASAYTDSLASLIILMLMTSCMFLFQLYMANQEKEILTGKQKEIIELNRAQNRFFSSMSHEIRTPVNTIIGFNEMILREKISDEVAEDAMQVLAAGKMLLHLVNDILDLSRLESGRMELANEEYSIGSMLSELVGMIWIHTQEKGLAFHVNVDPDLNARYIGDEMRIRQILINLLNNAVKYTKEGSVSFSVAQKETAGKDILVFTVSDTGKGIKKENIPYLFQAFKRVESSDNKRTEGTGLGLTIVKQLVDLMGGSIDVKSVYMQGSRFTVEIPQKKAGAEQIEKIDLKSGHALKARRKYTQRFQAPKARVLIVDDNMSNLMLTVKLLRDTKLETETAGSGEEALEKTLNTEYQLIFMDHLMPGMDGIECMHAIRSQAGGMSKDAKIIVLTANAGADSRRLYAREGFDAYLEKPLSPDALELCCIRNLPAEMVQISPEGKGIVQSSVQWMMTESGQKDIEVSTDSLADLPLSIIKKYGLSTINHYVRTENGLFEDGSEIGSYGLISYMEKNKSAFAIPPEAEDYLAFFAGKLTHARELLHISISAKIAGSGYANACKGADSFDQVKVFDSMHLSSGQGLLAVEAGRMAMEGMPAAEIVEKLGMIRDKIHTSFIVDKLDYMFRADLVGRRAAALSTALMIRPVISMKKGAMRISWLHLGSRQAVWKRYIISRLRHQAAIDKSLLFVTYVGLSQAELSWIREEIEKRAAFENIIFQKASPAIAVNCGPGTFGLIYKTL